MSHHPLAGVVEKLRNADSHMHRLQAECLSYLNGGANGRIVAERDPKSSGRGWFRFEVLRQPPLGIAAIAGDVVHNLRSSLDYIVEELVKRNGKSPGLQHQFPICATPDAFAKALQSGRLSGTHARAIRGIEGFQPFQVKAERRSKHPLVHLQRLSNRDKHHMLAIAALNGSFEWRFVDKRSGLVLKADRTTEPVPHGGVLAEVPTEFVIDDTSVQLQSTLTITIGFTEPEFTGFDVLGCLQNIREYIGIYMVPTFARFFDPMPDELRLTSHGIASEPTLIRSVAVSEERPPTAAEDK